MSALPSVNGLAAPLVDALLRDADALGLTVDRSHGCTLVDGGIACRGGLEAGRRIAEICMGGLGQVRLETNSGLANWPWRLTVHAARPLLACLASQYAGWSLSIGEGKEAYYAMGSGPGRALALKEPIFETLDYRDRAERTVLVLEVAKPPPRGLIDKVLRDCAVTPDALTLILTPTESLAGTVQIVARVLEVALHKVHELGFPLRQVVDGIGSAPLPPPAPKMLEAMGRTNDAIIYGGTVQLFVAGPDDAAADLAARLPSGTSPDYGRPFAEIFKAAKGDFYAIDPLLFSPAKVTVTALESGRSYHAGSIDETLVNRSFD
ncbi:MAG: methenyltetrahydromethanopterin cyclohydrolase [Pseudomonadota bacterium]